MAGHARYTALLDACVLYPVAMTDALLSLATAGFFAAKWTTLIETEWTRSLSVSGQTLSGNSIFGVTACVTQFQIGRFMNLHGVRW